METEGMSSKQKERVRTVGVTARRHCKTLFSEATTACARCLSASEEKLVLEYRTGQLKQLLIAWLRFD